LFGEVRSLGRPHRPIKRSRAVACAPAARVAGCRHGTGCAGDQLDKRR